MSVASSTSIVEKVLLEGKGGKKLDQRIWTCAIYLLYQLCI